MHNNKIPTGNYRVVNQRQDHIVNTVMNGNVNSSN